jgi:hypothetical protein
VPSLITAGHCGDVGNEFNLLHTYASIGQVTANLLGTTGDDIAAIRIDNGQFRNCIVLGTGQCRTVRITGQAPIQGAPVTKSGSTTGETSGVILSLGNSGGQPVMQTSARATYGDSGGAMWQENGDGTVNLVGVFYAMDAAGNSYAFDWAATCAKLGVDSQYCKASRPPAAPPAPSAPAPGRLGQLVSKSSGQCLTASGAGQVLTVNGCSRDGQVWTANSGRLQVTVNGSTLCATVAGSPWSNAPVTAAPCGQVGSGGTQQIAVAGGSLRVTSTSNMELAVKNAWTAPGTPLLLWTHNDGPNQVWSAK